MSKYQFSPIERAAIYSTHNEKCYLCGCPLDLKSMEVDHIFPESLLEKPSELKAILDAFGLPSDFNINSFVNWLPACKTCNGMKNNRVFSPIPIIQVYIQCAAEKAPFAQKLAGEIVSKRKIANALNVLEQTLENDKLEDEIVQTLIKYITHNRPIDLKGQPIHLTPLYEILTEQDGVQIICGPYGVGGKPTCNDHQSAFSCPMCGSNAAWNGARCVICGEMSDE